MTKIETLADLRLEKQRLHLKREKLVDEIKEDIEDVKQSLKPMNLIKQMFQSEKHEMNGEQTPVIPPAALNIGSTLIDFVMSKVFLKKSSFLKKIIYSYLIHTAGPSVIQKVGPGLFSTLKNLYSALIQKKDNTEEYSHSFEEEEYSDNYGYQRER